MQLVVDSAHDLAPSQRDALKVPLHVVPVKIVLAGKTYVSGDLTADQLFALLEETNQLPVTTPPTPLDFAMVFRKLAQQDPDILCVLISSGMSATVASARAAVEQVPEARVTIVDTKTLSVATGWQVEAAARAMQANWPLEEILPLLQRIQEQTDAVITLESLKYLLPGGRLTQSQALFASIFNIKPIIVMNKEAGVYERRGQALALDGAIRRMVKHIVKQHGEGTALRAQIVHGKNPLGVVRLRQELELHFDCHWLPTCQMNPSLGAHAGPTKVSVVYAPLKSYPELP